MDILRPVAYKPADLHPAADYVVREVTINGVTKKQPIIYAPDNSGEMQILLTTAQLRSLNSVRGEARANSEKSHEKFVSKYNNETLAWIENGAPIDVRFKVETLDFFVKDPIYRNLFETNRGNGSNDKSYRRNKEDNLFDGAYSYYADIERPKYGALNYLNLKSGTQATSYGQCWLRLKNEVKRRCTLTYGDSFGTRLIGTFDHCKHVLAAIPESAALIEAAANRPASAYKSPYTEVQIHGQLLLNRDVAAIYIPRELIQENSKKIEKLLRYGVDICPI